MAGEEDKVKFPFGMGIAEVIKGEDWFLMADENGEALASQWNKAKEFLNITGIELEPLVGGDSSATALVVANGPAGEQRTAEVSSGKWYDFGSGPVEASADRRWKSYWSGTSWVLKDMGALPDSLADGDVLPGNKKAPDGNKIYNKRASKRTELMADDFSKAFVSKPVAKEVVGSRFDNGYYIGSTGEFVYDPAYKTGPFQKYVGPDPLMYKGEIDGLKPAVVGFDQDFNYLGVVSGPLVSNSVYTNVPVTLPGVVYVRPSFKTNGNESFIVPTSEYAFNITIKNPQLFNKSAVVTEAMKQFGVMENRYISNTTGALNTSNGWYTAYVPLTNYKYPRIYVTGVTTFAENKWGRFIDSSGALISFGSYADLSTIGLAVPSNAIAFEVTVKHANDPMKVMDSIMISFDKSPYESFRSNPATIGAVMNIPLSGNVDTGIKQSPDTFMIAGDSLVKQGDGTGTYPGLQVLLKEKVNFANFYSFGYPGSALTAPTEGTGSIIQNRSAWTIGDVNALLCGTNDFRLSRPIGDFHTDYINGTGLNYFTFYGALRVYIDYIRTSKPQSSIIFITPPNRDNSGYNTYTKNSVNKTLVDYCIAMELVAEKEGIPIISSIKEVPITLRSLGVDTWDGLHLNSSGYAKLFAEFYPKVLKIIR
ncbi:MULTISPECIES: GDSL-type esterase/lipase family protein [unclassified Sphingobacterium]|uniref:SGNH/GDSL hydrolase family protein n=1 Tax=unclassified Sphingobacterium TaxID=2609468 RepID=UPI0020C55A5C|nr:MULTISPECIES: GDSL-type esterase/lipase family protein [unclassified Sphingobacterium]